MNLSETLLARPGEMLGAHLRAVGELARTLARAVPATALFPEDTLERLARLVGLCHDVGKAGGRFQQKVRAQTPVSVIHAMPGAALAGLWAAALPWPPGWQELAPALCAMVVRDHHAPTPPAPEQAVWTSQDLRMLDRWWAESTPAALTALLRAIGCPWSAAELRRRMLDPTGPPTHAWGAAVQAAWATAGLRMTVAMLLLFSLLVDADRLATACRETGLPLPTRQDLPPDAVACFRRRQGWDRPQTPVDRWRNRLADLVAARLRTEPVRPLLTLTAPTGLGKTLVALESALTLRARLARDRDAPPRIVYALPYLSLIEQTEAALAAVFPDADSGAVLTQHHQAPLLYRQDGREYHVAAPDLAALLRDGWEAELVVTTTVQLYETLIGARTAAARRFHRLAGAIIVLDEPQTLPPPLWPVFREILRTLTATLHTHVLLLTATQPVIFSPEETQELAPEAVAWTAALNRTVLELRPEPMTAPMLADLVCRDLAAAPDRSALVILNTHATAQAVYRRLAETLSGPHTLVYLSAHVPPILRRERLRRLQTADRPFVVVSTPVLDTGVQLDAHLCYRALAPVDRLIQAAGRCNRHGLRDRGRVVVVDVLARGRSTADMVYDPITMSATRETLTAPQIAEADYPALARAYFSRVAARLSPEPAATILAALAAGDVARAAAFPFFPHRGPEERPVCVLLDATARAAWAAFLEARRRGDGPRLRTLWATLAPYCASVETALLTALGVPNDDTAPLIALDPRRHARLLQTLDPGLSRFKSS